MDLDLCSETLKMKPSRNSCNVFSESIPEANLNKTNTDCGENTLRCSDKIYPESEKLRKRAKQS